MPSYFTLNDFSWENKQVLVRVDFNVPLQEGRITDMTRIMRALPTIHYLKSHGAKITLMSHLGRPKGKDLSFSLAPVAEALAEHSGYEVRFIEDCLGEARDQALHQQYDELLLLENLRFYPEEKANDPTFARALAAPYDFLVNDAFGVAHREAASVVAIAKEKPLALGLLFQEEIEKLSIALQPERPFMVIIGGAKISTKIDLLQHFLEKADAVLLGGAMIFTFYKAMGLEIGKSLYEESMVPVAKQLLANPKIILPADVVIAQEKSNDAPTSIVSFKAIPPDAYGLDIGPLTLRQFHELLSTAKTIVWNGPMGLFEIPQFAEGTRNLAQQLAILDAKVIVGGGDSVAALNQLGLSDQFYHVSTGGGASLAFLQGKPLPALRAAETSYQLFS